jgi:signal transduction histidine kinase
LPLALVLASGGAIAEHALTVGLRLLQGVPGSEAMTDAWQLILVLFVPLILDAWQYSIPTVLVFVLATTGLDFSLTVVLAVAAGYRAASPITVMFLRALVYGLVGYVVVQLMQARRAQQAALAEANAQLARYATTLEQLTLSRERNRMARELHDTLAHSLSAVAVQLEATRSLWDEDPIGARSMLDGSLAMTRHGLSEARRAIRALRAVPLEDLGLALALRQAAALVAERGGLRLEVAVADRTDGLPQDVAQVVYRVAMEAMENVVRHAAANVLDVSLLEAGEHWVLTVADDGRGFDAAGTASDKAPNGRNGLQGMRERAAMVGADLEIESRPGAATSVRLRIGRG